jgi:hypothetical protein
MFFHLLYIHLFRPFLKYNPSTSPLPSHVSPRKLCTQAASLISKLMRLYKRTYGLRQICNIAVYIVHSACTIHLLNLPDKAAKRDIVHGIKHLEEIAEDWLCARRTLSILSVLARKWKVELPEEALAVLTRTDAKYGTFSTSDVPSPKSDFQYLQPSTANSPSKSSNPQTHQAAVYSKRLPSESTHASNNASPNPSTQVNRLSNGGMFASSMPSVLQHSTPTSIAGNPQMPLPNESVMNIASNFLQRQSYTISSEHSSPVQQPSTTQPPVTQGSRQLSPGTLFGGVDALVESQDWWLRDQASLAVGFENWGGLDGDMGLGNVGTTGGALNGVDGYFLMGNNTGGSPGLGGFGTEEWFG